MDAHSFCRNLLKAALYDLKQLDHSFRSSSLTTTKSTLGGYEVQGNDGFYLYASSACCVWSAKAEAIDKIIDSKTETDLSESKGGHPE